MYSTNYMTSSIDWCESNNVYNVNIVEMWNSFSSLFISLFGIIGINNFPETKNLYYTLIPIGVSSFYFHASLSLLGQLLDEFFIMYSIAITSHYINNNIYNFCNKYLLACINFIQIILLFLFPELNRLFLFGYGFYSLIILNHIKNNIIHESNNNIVIAENLFFLSVICWLIDFMCVFTFNFHSLWHILIGLTGYHIFFSLGTIHKYLHKEKNSNKVNFYVV